MNKILKTEDAVIFSNQLHLRGKSIVLTGGCFDILHIGHIKFLEKAKNQADFLMVMLESDKNIRERKGEDRPFNTQEDRAHILAALEMVDAVIMLPIMDTNSQYDHLVSSIKPDIIATTEGDRALVHKERQAKVMGIKVVSVTQYISNRSTSTIARSLQKEL